VYVRDVTDEESTGIKKVKKSRDFALNGSTMDFACRYFILHVSLLRAFTRAFPPVNFYY